MPSSKDQSCLVPKPGVISMISIFCITYELLVPKPAITCNCNKQESHTSKLLVIRDGYFSYGKTIPHIVTDPFCLQAIKDMLISLSHHIIPAYCSVSCTVKDPCNYTGPTWTMQGNLPILSSSLNHSCNISFVM